MARTFVVQDLKKSIPFIVQTVSMRYGTYRW
jgi:hypothetical protein